MSSLTPAAARIEDSREQEETEHREPESSYLQQSETVSPLKPETIPDKSEAACLEEPENATLQEPVTAFLQDTKTTSLQKSETASVLEPGTTSPQKSYKAPLQGEETSFPQNPKTSLHEAETASLHEPESSLHLMETGSLQLSKTADKQQPMTDSPQEQEGASLQVTKIAAPKEPNSLAQEPKAAFAQEKSAHTHQDNCTSVSQDENMHKMKGMPSGRKIGACELQDSAQVPEKDAPSRDQTNPTRNDAPDGTDEKIKGMMLAVMSKMQNLRAQRPASNHWDRVAENLGSKILQEELKTKGDVDRSGSCQQQNYSTNAGDDSKGTSNNGGARPKESPANGGVLPKESQANGSAFAKETAAMEFPRSKYAHVNNGGARPKETARNGCIKTRMSKAASDGCHNIGATAQKQELKFRWRGHRNDLLEREQDESLMHLVLPYPCFNNHTVHFGFLSRGDPTKRVNSDRSVESDGGFAVFRCEDESECSRKCPVSYDDEGFPVVAMDFDSFCMAYHVETDQCQECRRGVGLARASITGRARLIYEQMNGAHPQQTAFRIWEHERGVRVNTSKGKPPPTNTLITVEKVHDRDLKPQEYEHLFSVLMGLRGVQSLFAFASASWGSTHFADPKRNPMRRKKDIEIHAENVTSILQKSGILLPGEDNKFRGTVPARCRPGKDMKSAEAEAWFPRVDRNCVEMQCLQSSHDKRGQRYPLEAVDVSHVTEVLWGTMISINQPMAEKYYLDMPFTSQEVPAEEQLVSENRLLKSSSFRQTFLAQLKAASGQGKLAWLGPHHSWNGVLYTWKLRRRPEDYVRDLCRYLMRKEHREGTAQAGPSSQASTSQRDTNGEAAVDSDSGDVGTPRHGDGDSHKLRIEGRDPQDNGSDIRYASVPVEDTDAPAPGDKKGNGLNHENGGESRLSSERVDSSDHIEMEHSLIIANAVTQACQLEISPVTCPVSKTGNVEVETLSSDVSPELSDNTTESPKLTQTSPQLQMVPSTDISEKYADGKGRARITRVESKDSGYQNSSGSGSGTTSRDDSTTRSGSIERGSEAPESGSPSSNSGQTSPVDRQMGSESDRSSNEQGPSKEMDLRSQHEPDTASDQTPYPGSNLLKPTGRDDTANGESEQTLMRRQESILSGSPVEKFADKAALAPYRQGEDTFCSDDGNASDASTIKGSASTLTKSSRRRSSGEISAGSEFDDAASLTSKSYSPSKSSGRDSLSKDEVTTGEALQKLTIPEEHDVPSEESSSDAMNASERPPDLPPSKLSSKQRPNQRKSSSEAHNLKTSSSKVRPKPTPVHLREYDRSRSFMGMTGMPKNIKMYAHLKNPEIHITENENEEFMNTVTYSLWSVTRESSYPAFMRIDDRSSVNSESLRSLSANDFEQQRYHGYTYKCLLNVCPHPEPQFLLHGVQLPSSAITTSADGTEHPHEQKRETRGKHAGETTPDGNVTVQSSTSTGRAQGSGFSTSQRESSRDIGAGRRFLPSTGLSSRALKKSPLRFLSTIEVSHSHTESKNRVPPLTDTKEHYFGLSSISRRQIKRQATQARFLCQRIMQRGTPLNCLCDAITGDDQLEILAAKLEGMLTKGRIVQFLYGQRELLEHACSTSVMDSLRKASYPTETDAKILNDLMLILGMHHDPEARPQLYCTGKTESVGPGSAEPHRPADGEKLAALTCKEAGSLLARHHLWSMRQTDFFDLTRDDPLTCMTLHEHGLKELEKAMKFTPFQLFLEWHLSRDLLQGLCDELNAYARARDKERSFRGWNELSPDELRVFLLHMMYMASKHSRDKRWDGPPRKSHYEKKQDQMKENPDDPAQAVDGSDKASGQQGHEVKVGDVKASKVIERSDRDSDPQKEDEAKSRHTESEAIEDLSRSPSEERSGRANANRLRASMNAYRFRQIAASWRVFDFCGPPRRSERQRRLKKMQTVLDALVDDRAVKTLPALLAVGASGIRCRNTPVAHRRLGHRRVDVAFVIDGKRYIHDVVITEAKGRQRFRSIHPSVVNRIRNKLRPSGEKNITVAIQQINNVASKLARSQQPSVQGMVAEESQKRAPWLPDNMIRFFYMDGLRVSDAERCADSGILCMAPISSDDPRCSEFAAVDEDRPKVVSDNGHLTCVSYGSKEKVNFFYNHGSNRRRYRLVCSAFHQLDGIGGRRAHQQVEKTQHAVRKAVKQITSRLSRDSTRSGLRYYHRLFLQALSACVQNTIIAHAVARKRRVSEIAASTVASTSSTAVQARVPFDSSVATLTAHCDAEFEKFLSEMMDWLEKTPKVGPKSRPKLDRAQMHAALTEELLNLEAVDGGMRSEMLIHNADKMASMLQNMVEKTRQVGDKHQQKQHGPVVVETLGDMVF